jgi:hypothetical protein
MANPGNRTLFSLFVSEIFWERGFERATELLNRHILNALLSDLQ